MVCFWATTKTGGERGERKEREKKEEGREQLRVNQDTCDMCSRDTKRKELSKEKSTGRKSSNTILVDFLEEEEVAYSWDPQLTSLTFHSSSCSPQRHQIKRFQRESDPRPCK